MEQKKTIKKTITILILSWFLILNVFLSKYISLNWVSKDYMEIYWFSVYVYFLGLYFAVSYYFIHK